MNPERFGFPLQCKPPLSANGRKTISFGVSDSTRILV
jgi:hypothetical protein